MRAILAVSVLLLVSQNASAYNMVDHPTRNGYKRVTCNDGRQKSLRNDHRVYDRAKEFCNESRRGSSAGSSSSNSWRDTSSPDYSSGNRRDSTSSGGSASSSGSVRCSATQLRLESEWKPGERVGTISVPSTRPVTGNYDRSRHRGDTVCVGGEHKGKREQFQFYCSKNGEWKFGQRLWARDSNCRNDGMISTR